MKQIACIHTVASVIDSFTAQLREGIPGDYLIHTMYDDFLATDPARTGAFSEVNVRRLGLDMESMALTGADMIVVTCSTLSPAVRILRNRFDIPVVAIDDAMARAAVAAGSRITVIATANSTVKPSLSGTAHSGITITRSADAALPVRRNDRVMADGRGRERPSGRSEEIKATEGRERNTAKAIAISIMTADAAAMIFFIWH